MQADPIVAEIRERRDQRAAHFGYDIRALVRDAQERDAVGDREVVRLLSRRPVSSDRSMIEKEGSSVYKRNFRGNTAYLLAPFTGLSAKR